MRTKLNQRSLPDYTHGEEVFNMVSHIVGGADLRIGVNFNGEMLLINLFEIPKCRCKFNTKIPYTQMLQIMSG